MEFYEQKAGYNRAWLCLVCFLLMPMIGVSQKKGKVIKPNKQKITIHSENNQVVDATTAPPIQYLNGDVKIFHVGTFMYCDTAILRGNYLRMRHNVVMMQNDTIRIFADSMRYNGDSLVAHLYGQIILENGPNKKLYTTYIRYDVKNKIADYNRNARMVDGSSTVVSKRGRYFLNQKMAYFYDNVQAWGKDFRMISDSTAYHTGDQRIIFIAPTRITQDTSQTYSEKGWFDTKSNSGKFYGNAQYTSGKTIAKSDTIAYDGKIDLVSLISKDSLSQYYTDTDTAYARVIRYDKKNEQFTLIEEAYFKNKENEVNGKKVTYSKKDETFKTEGRALVSDPPYLIEADTLDYIKAQKKGQGHGNVIWRDTSNKSAIHAEHLFFDESQSKMLAYSFGTLRPQFQADIEGDTMTMKADTLRSHRTIKERLILPKKLTDRQMRMAKKNEKLKEKELVVSEKKDSILAVQPMDSLKVSMDTLPTDTIFTGIMDTINYIIGDNLVKIYKSDMQAIGDSIVFNRRDSIITLYDQPFVWSDSTQLKGDTIDIFLKNGTADKMVFRNNATIINTEDVQFFNQIKGRDVTAFFVDRKIHHADVDGNAQMVYYMVDDAKAYIGVNTSESSNMTFYFKDRKVTSIKSFSTPRSKVIPMKDAQHEKLKIQGFIWNNDARPKSVNDL
jgi:lipopolysaccharide export system protein LptA